MPAPGRPLRDRLALIAAALPLLALVSSGCASAAQPGRGPDKVVASSVENSSDVAALLDGLGVERAYVMAGPEIMRAGFGVLTADGLQPMTLTPDPAMVSNISGNGLDVVMGAAVPPDDDPNGFLLDGAYLLQGNRLKTLAGPGSGKFAPTIAADGMVAAISADGGFWTRMPGGPWTRDPRLRNVPMSGLEWARSGAAYSLIRPGTSKTRLVRIKREGAGVKRLGAVTCATGVLVAPTHRLLVTRPPWQRKPKLRGCHRATVLDFNGQVVAKLPKGWRPSAWSADSSQVLVGRGTVVALWDESGLGNRVEIAAPIWEAAPIYGQETETSDQD